MSASNVQANVLSRLKRHASDGEDKIGSPGSIVNAVARELHKISNACRGVGTGRDNNIQTCEEMKTVSKKRRSVSFCNMFLICSTAGGK